LPGEVLNKSWTLGVFLEHARHEMKVKIHIDRSAAIRAGRDSYGDTIVVVNLADLTEGERDLLAAAPEHAGTADLTDARANKWPGQYPRPPVLADADDALAAARAWLAWHGACCAERERVAEEEAAKKSLEQQEAIRRTGEYIAYWRNQPAESFVQGGDAELPQGGGDLPSLPNGFQSRELRRMAEKALAGKIEEARVLIAERKHHAPENLAGAERTKAEGERRRTAQLVAWVSEHGTISQQGRFKLGLLPEAEILDLIRSAVYTPLDGFVRFETIRWSEIEHTDECAGPEGGMDYSTTVPEALTAGEFALCQEIEHAAPQGATLKVLAHACECRACGAGLIRKSLRVALQEGELCLTREYALDAAP
jgi:hypothetical protein